MMGVQSLGPIIPRCVAEGSAVMADVGRARDLAAEPIRPADAGRIEPIAAAQEREAWVALLSVPGLGPVSFGALLRALGSARAVMAVAGEADGATRLVQALVDGQGETCGDETGVVFDSCATAGEQGRRRPSPIGADLAARICEAPEAGLRIMEEVRALGLTVVILEDAAYPARLKLVEMPPPLLFVRGSAAALNSERSVAVVGTRHPTDKGRLIAGWIGSAVSRTGSVVVSGLALGVDGAAHAAVVAEAGITVAVLGGGHARLFPKAHERLADAMVAAGGAIVSELPPDTSPTRGTFPRRNRLISGLSDATVVVEAGRRSGALITAGWALEQGRECFLVPGAFDSPASAGCHAFLRSFPGQTRVVCGIEELLEDLDLVLPDGGKTAESGVDQAKSPSQSVDRGGPPGSSARAAGRAAVLASLGVAERALAVELSQGPATADQLAARTSMTAASVLSAITLLELRGLITGTYGRYSPAGQLAGWRSGAPAELR
ncbi:MAG TPA: DNA-processing protein DprA [Candidatus Limnocylindrales bacterium]